MRRALMGIVVASIAGCAGSHEMGDGGTLDSPPVGRDAPSAVSCGPVTCSAGLLCCNASCGLCTAPGVGCTDIACSDAGAARACGGLTSGACGPSEYCDYPDGSECGASDAEGSCQPRPTACPPGGATLCGCDGNDYLGECAAYESGTDFAHAGTCHPTMPARSLSAIRTCAPFDGPAWRLDVTPGTTGVCDGSDAHLRIELYGDLATLATPVTITLGTSTGVASACPGGGAPCANQITGTVTIHSFVPDGVGEISYTLHNFSSTTPITADHLPVVTWCSGTPVCGA